VIGFDCEQSRARGLVATRISALIEFSEAFLHISSELMRSAELTAVLNTIFS
jgi:hypothetical protein